MSAWKRPHVEVGQTVSFFKYRNTEPRALVVTDINDKTISGMMYKGGGQKWVDCVFHVDDPELEARPQMQEAMWDHTAETKMVLKMWDHLGLGEANELAKPEVFNTDKRMDLVTIEENRELDHVRQMMHAGILDKGRLCKESGVHHKRVEKELNAFLAKKRQLANS